MLPYVHNEGTLKGECYGMKHDANRFKNFGFVGPVTPIKNLYLGGHDVFTNGFAGAIFGGEYNVII
jgi:all-trans-retinol 13,14-reductase